MTLSDNELIINAQNGDILAFEELIYRYDKMVLRIAFKYTGDNDDAKDIYQEVFIKVYKGLLNFQFKSEFSTWLFRITSNTCITFKRKYARANHFSLDDEKNESYISTIPDDSELSPENLAINSENEKKINEALNSLSPNQKMSFLLKHYEGYKIREIAEMMNCKEGTIKKYLFDAIKRLKLQLENSY
ncbi:MAG: RNA polymerase sigma factor [Ignavibacteriales bacterium]|nr:RNA polymerase sigma factor [Ignavibacteriales bacterium]